jgi:hypothetical protein
MMIKKNKDSTPRRSFLTGMGVAAAGVVAGTGPAHAQESGFQPARHDSDAWMGELPGKHRVWIDTSYGLGGMEALHYSNNILTANVNVNGGTDDDYALVLCWRHYATALGYMDPAWEKYGEFFSAAMHLNDPQTGKAFTVNPANITGRADLDNGGDTIDKMLGRGVKFALCNAATVWYAGYIAGETGGNAKEIYKEFVDLAVPDSRFIAAGVFGTTRAQEYGYSLLYAG